VTLGLIMDLDGEQLWTWNFRSISLLFQKALLLIIYIT